MKSSLWAQDHKAPSGRYDKSAPEEDHDVAKRGVLTAAEARCCSKKSYVAKSGLGDMGGGNGLAAKLGGSRFDMCGPDPACAFCNSPTRKHEC